MKTTPLLTTEVTINSIFQFTSFQSSNSTRQNSASTCLFPYKIEPELSRLPDENNEEVVFIEIMKSHQTEKTISAAEKHKDSW